MNTEHKIELYRRAAGFILHRQESGICLGLQRAHEAITGEKIPAREMRHLFPELYQHRPAGALWNFYWWHIMDKETRLKVINEIIETLTANAANTTTVSG